MKIGILHKSGKPDWWDDFTRVLSDNDVTSQQTSDVAVAMEWIKQKWIGLIVVEEDLGEISGVTFLEKAMQLDAMLNSAMVSSVSAKEFHEKTEGLGVLLQLPEKPGEAEAELLLSALDKVAGLMAAVNGESA